MILQLVWILWPWAKDITDRIESSVRFVARRLSRRHAKDKEGLTCAGDFNPYLGRQKLVFLELLSAAINKFTGNSLSFKRVKLYHCTILWSLPRQHEN